MILPSPEKKVYPKIRLHTYLATKNMKLNPPTNVYAGMFLGKLSTHRPARHIQTLMGRSNLMRHVARGENNILCFGDIFFLGSVDRPGHVPPHFCAIESRRPW